VQSIGQSSLSIKESAVWLNAILSKLWRVGSGGIEPLLSSSASASLAESLEHPISKPSVVAHVALESFSFGSSPPIFSNIEITGIDDDQSAVYMKVDMGMLLHDAVLLLGKWLSSFSVFSLLVYDLKYIFLFSLFPQRYQTLVP
jgi:Ca2+-dependent lipid-binding protein